MGTWFVRKITFLLVAIASSPFIVAFFLPRNYTIPSVEEIVADKVVVNEVLCSFQYQAITSHFVIADSNCVYAFFGDNGVVGSKLSWKSSKPKYGSGEIILTSLTPNRVDLEIHYFKPIKSVAYATFVVRSCALNATEITYNYYMTSDFPYNLMTYFFEVDEIFERNHTSITRIRKIIEIQKP